jgi:membrane fusion protein, multidrug efflux system
MSSFFKAHRIIAIIVLIVAGAWVGTGEFAAVGSQEASASQPDAAAPAAKMVERTVAAMAPEFTNHARVIRVSGATEADKRAVLAARSNGIVVGLGVAEGEAVAADAIVLQLDGADVTADVATAEATLVQKARELEVALKLYENGNTPELQLTSARAAKSAAEAQLAQAQAAADRLNLRAPFAGVVDQVNVELGEWVQAGAPIATVLALNPIVVRADVGELDIASVKVGGKAGVRLVNGAELEGVVRTIGNEASAQTRTFAVEIALPNADRMIPAGMTAEVSLFSTPVKAVVVPRSVITLSAEGVIGLRVVNDDNIARFVPVTLIDDTPDGLVVTGVPDHVRIITAGQDLVREDEKVIVADGVAAPAKAAAGVTE